MDEKLVDLLIAHVEVLVAHVLEQIDCEAVIKLALRIGSLLWIQNAVLLEKVEAQNRLLVAVFRCRLRAIRSPV